MSFLWHSWNSHDGFLCILIIVLWLRILQIKIS
jgi:hypothetical protein